MKEIRLLIYLVLVFFISCTNEIEKTENIVKIDNEKADSLYINSELTFVPLETNKSSLLGNIINVEVTDKYIYVLDRDAFFIFTNEGRFIKKTVKGKGPGELSYPINFSFNKDRGEIYIIEYGNIIHIFDEIGAYKETYKLAASYADILRINDDEFLLYTAMPPKYESHLVSVYNLKTKEITTKYIPYETLKMKDFSLLTRNNFSVIDGDIYLMVSNSRHMYHYTGNGFEDLFVFDFEELEPELAYLKRFNNVRSFKKMAFEDGFVAFINYNYMFKDFNILGISHKKYNCAIRYKNKNTMFISTLSKLFNLPNTISFKMPINANSNHLYFLYNNDIFVNNVSKDNTAKLIIHGKEITVKENDNPVLVSLLIK